jgi:hypothetical protein
MRWTAAVATVLVVSLSATAPSSAQSVPTSTTTLVGVAQPPVKLPPLVQRHFPALPHRCLAPSTLRNPCVHRGALPGP